MQGFSIWLRVVVIFCFAILAYPLATLAQETVKPIELNADQLEHILEESKTVAQGHVVVIRGDTKITCDKMIFYREKNLVIAEGHVILRFKESMIYAEKMNFNMKDMTGDFTGARIFADPYYGTGKSISKVAENHIVIKDGRFTTCDLLKPHYCLASKQVDIYPKEKAVAKNTRLIVGKLPILYIPQFVQDLKDKKPRVLYTPGYDKQWGMFLLTRWRYYFNENFKGTVHLDAREKKNLAEGLDLEYNTKNFGKGLIRTYYMNERNTTASHFWQARPSPTMERERFKAEWRHQWKIDDKTDTILQFYRLSDNGILKDYFKREYEKDQNPETFFQLTRLLPLGTFSLRVDDRVNRFVSTLERLPELQYSLGSLKIGQTNLYLKDTTTYSNLSLKDASPTEVRRETQRLDTDNELSYPLKISFIEIRPFIGGRQTYYSKTKDITQYNIIRGIFRTGSDLSTKFYKVYDVNSKVWGVEINRLRHIITPSIAYLFTTDPTVPSTKLDSFDSLDSLTQNHSITFSLENKLQTKRKKASVDLLRLITSTDFNLKENAGTGGFNHITSQLDFKPVDWLTFYWDANYNAVKDHLETFNFDLYLTNKDKWAFSLGKRFARRVDDQITTDIQYTINPKWKIRSYYRFDVDGGSVKEQEYTISRDLHCWEMDLSFNETRGEGSEIWIVFRLKAFPDLGFDFSSSFNKRKTGSQSSP